MLRILIIFADMLIIFKSFRIFAIFSPQFTLSGFRMFTRCAIDGMLSP